MASFLTHEDADFLNHQGTKDTQGAQRAYWSLQFAVCNLQGIRSTTAIPKAFGSKLQTAYSLILTSAFSHVLSAFSLQLNIKLIFPAGLDAEFLLNGQHYFGLNFFPVTMFFLQRSNHVSSPKTSNTLNAFSVFPWPIMVSFPADSASSPFGKIFGGTAFPISQWH